MLKEIWSNLSSLTDDLNWLMNYLTQRQSDFRLSMADIKINELYHSCLLSSWQIIFTKFRFHLMAFDKFGVPFSFLGFTQICSTKGFESQFSLSNHQWIMKISIQLFHIQQITYRYGKQFFIIFAIQIIERQKINILRDHIWTTRWS